MCKIKQGKLLYHLTALDNIPSIIQSRLLPRACLDKGAYTDIADPSIIDIREQMWLSNYIPFHFHIHTAFDTAVKKSNPNRKFVYLCLQRAYAENNDFPILPNHPLSFDGEQLYSYQEGFKRIDWNVMEMTQDDADKANIDRNYHKQVRMAECLSPSPIYVSSFIQIGVPDDDIGAYIQDLFEQFEVWPRPYIHVQNWF